MTPTTTSFPHSVRPLQKPNVTVSIGGAFPSPYQYAEALQAEGQLEHLISFMPRRWSRKRFHHTLPDEQLTTIDWIGALYKGLSPVISASSLSLWTSRLFDRATSRRLRNCNLLNVWSGSALHSIRKAKREGIGTVLCTGSAQARFQKDVIETEYRSLGLNVVATTPAMVLRAEAEYEESDAIVVPSTFVKGTLTDSGVAPGKIYVVPHPLTRDLRVPRQPADKFTILCVGSQGIRKGTHHLLEAMKTLNLPNAELVLAGGIQHEFEPIMRSYPGIARLAGRVSEEELSGLYSQASIFVLPSVEDGWGHVTLEAMSCGVAPIVSRNAGSADAVIDGVNGLTFAAGDVRGLMAALAALHGDRPRAFEMGRQAAQTAVEYTQERYGREMLDVFSSVLNSVQAGPS